MSVTVSNSPIQDFVHLDDHTQPTYENDSGVQTFHSFNESAVKLLQMQMSCPANTLGLPHIQFETQSACQQCLVPS